MIASGYLMIGVFGFICGTMLGVHAGYRLGRQEDRQTAELRGEISNE